MVVSETINVLCPNRTMSGVDKDRDRNRDRNRDGGEPCFWFLYNDVCFMTPKKKHHGKVSAL